jgi:hypothetical protein
MLLSTLSLREFGAFSLDRSAKTPNPCGEAVERRVLV